MIEHHQTIKTLGELRDYTLRMIEICGENGRVGIAKTYELGNIDIALMTRDTPSHPPYNAPRQYVAIQ